jgi:hypothetical protein
LVESLLKLARLDWPVPDFSTLCRRQNDLTVTIPYRSSQGALHLLIDSTGIKAMGEGEWSCRKHGASRPRQWAKVHLGLDAETLEVRAIEGELANAAEWGMGPCCPSCCRRSRPRSPSARSRLTGPMTPEPVTPPSPPARPRPFVGDPIPRIGSGSSSLPTRRNERPWKETTPGAQARNDILRASHRFGRVIWRNWSGYHRRRLIEAKMRCLKLLDERLSARTPDRQTAELQIRVALMNRFSALGTPETVRVA